MIEMDADSPGVLSLAAMTLSLPHPLRMRVVSLLAFVPVVILFKRKDRLR
jgi:hypothetical protein